MSKRIIQTETQEKSLKRCMESNIYIYINNFIGGLTQKKTLWKFVIISEIFPNFFGYLAPKYSLSSCQSLKNIFVKKYTNKQWFWFKNSLQMHRLL